MAFVLDVNLRIQEILGLQKVEAALSKLKSTAKVGATGGTAGAAKSQVTVLNANASATKNITTATDKLSASQRKGANSTRKVSAAMTEATNKAGSFGESVRIAGRRYAAFVVSTAVPFAALGAIAKSTAAVIEFDTAILKVRQILGQTASEVNGLRDTILNLATSTGTSANEIAEIGKVLVQAGQRGDELRDSLDALSKVPLTPSFESIDAALEGSIAALNQFRKEGLTTTKVLDVLTAVSNKFAASSEDIAKGISRGGAAFEAIGGTFKEFVSVFTTVRQATRESAETVGTFLKTISSRLADPKIVDFLEGKGIRISEAIEAGNPVGAIKAIAAALKNTVSIQDKIEIGTKLGGRRQISRLLALISNIDVLDKSLLVAGDSSGAFGKIAEEGLQGLQAQLNIVGQEFNKLVQELAQPLFVPIIRGVTSLASAFSSVVSIVKPVIPVFTAIVGFIAGFKALELAIKGVAFSAKLLGSANLVGGLPGLVGAFGGAAGGAAGGTNRERIQRRLGGQRGLADGARGASRVGIIAGGAQGAGGLSVGQLAIAATLFAVMGQASTAFEEAGNSTGVLVSEFLKGAATIAIAASLLSGQSIVGIGKTILSFLGPFGTALGVGVTALGLFASAANNAVDLDVQTIIDEGAKKISQIEVPTIKAGDTEGLEKTVDELGSTAIKTLQGSLNRMDSGFSGFVTDFTSSIGNLLAGEGFTEISDAQAQDMIKKIIGKNPELLNEIIRASIEEFGIGNLEKELDKLFTKAFDGNVEAAQRFRAGLISIVGGIGKIADQFAKSGIDKETKKLSDAIGTAVSSFRTLRVPAAISSQLSLLSDSIGKAVKNINRNIQLFDSLSQGIGQGISLPQLPPTDFSEKAVKNLIIGDQLEGFGIPSNIFKDISGLTSDTAKVEFALQDILKSLLASKADADTLVKSLTDPQVDPSDILDEFIDNFLKESNQDLNPESKALLRATAKKLAQQINKSLIKFGGIENVDEIVKAGLEDALGNTTQITDAMVSSVQQFLNTSADLAAKQIEALVIDAQIDVRTATRPQTQAADLAGNLANIGIGGGLAPGDSFNKQSGSQFILDIGTNVDIATRAVDNLRSATDFFTGAARENEKAQKLGGEAAALAGKQLGLAKVNLLDALKASEGIRKAAQDAPSIQREQDQRRGVDNERRQQIVDDVSASIVESISRTTQKVQLASAVEISNIFKTPAQNFAEALNSSTARLNIFTRALTLEDLEAGRGAPKFGVTDDERVTVSRAPVPEASVKEERVFDAGVIQSVAFGSSIEEVAKAVKNAANEQIKSNIQLFSRDRGTPRQEDLDLSRSIGDTSSIKDLFALISRSSLNQTTLLADVAKDLRAQAAVPGAKTIDKEASQSRNSIADQIRQLAALLTNPALADDPRPLVPTLSKEQIEIIQNLSKAPAQSQPDTIGVDSVALDSISSIQDAASKTQLAAEATTSSTENIRLSTENIQLGVVAVDAASKNMLESATQLAAITDAKREAISSEQEITTGAVSNDGSIEAIAQNTEKVALLGEQMGSMANALEEQIKLQQESAETEEQEPIQIEGLDANTIALGQSEESIDANNEKIGELGTSMAAMAGAIEDGVGIDIETMSEISVNIQGIAAAAKEFTSDFEQVAMKVVKAEIKIILQKLASASGNSELAQTFESVVA